MIVVLILKQNLKIILHFDILRAWNSRTLTQSPASSAMNNKKQIIEFSDFATKMVAFGPIFKDFATFIFAILFESSHSATFNFAI